MAPSRRLSAPKSPEDREVANILRHYREIHGDTGVVDRAIIASEARKALRRDRPVIPALRHGAAPPKVPATGGHG
jgi:hypothetical protein